MLWNSPIYYSFSCNLLTFSNLVFHSVVAFLTIRSLPVQFIQPFSFSHNRGIFRNLSHIYDEAACQGSKYTFANTVALTRLHTFNLFTHPFFRHYLSKKQKKVHKNEYVERAVYFIAKNISYFRRKFWKLDF